MSSSASPNPRDFSDPASEVQQLARRREELEQLAARTFPGDGTTGDHLPHIRRSIVMGVHDATVSLQRARLHVHLLTSYLWEELERLTDVAPLEVPWNIELCLQAASAKLDDATRQILDTLYAIRRLRDELTFREADEEKRSGQTS